MITNEELDFLKLKEPRIDFLEDTDSESKPPVQRPLARIAETAQLFTAMDLYNARAELDVAIQKAEQDLTPKIWKLKVKGFRDKLERDLESYRKQKETFDDEIKLLEDPNGLNITEVEKEWNQALHEKLKAEANQPTPGAEISD